MIFGWQFKNGRVGYEDFDWQFKDGGEYLRVFEWQLEGREGGYLGGSCGGRGRDPAERVAVTSLLERLTWSNVWRQKERREELAMGGAH